MRKAIVFCLAISLISCGKTDDSLEGECIGVIDFANAGIFQIELVDAIGNNLIQDGLYNPEMITTSINGVANGGVFENFDASISRDTIRLFTVGSEGANRWLLHLSEMDTDTLDFTLSFKEERALFNGDLFCGTQQILNSARYNGEPIEFTSESEGIIILNISVLK